MYVVVTVKNANDKIELTKEELQNMQDGAYKEGYNKGKESSYVWTSPYVQTTTTYDTICTPSNNDSITYRTAKANLDLNGGNTIANQ